jgi:peptidoglycan/xylan/chitin deacetylase (PgdA/CDA1 family)
MLTAIPLITVATLSVTAAASVYYASYAVRSQWLGRTVWQGPTDSSSVALTFDDGPSRETDRILDVLDQYRVRATFFMVGRQIETFPGVAQRAAEMGHEIGNHSYSHPIYLYRSARETRNQLERTQQIIADVTGVIPSVARPPCGVRTPAYFRAARALGLQTVQWTVAGFDWKKRDARHIARAVLRDVRAGSIILLHDGDSRNLCDRSPTVAALPLIFEGLKDRGLHVAPLRLLLDPHTASPAKGRTNTGMRTHHNA